MLTEMRSGQYKGLSTSCTTVYRTHGPGDGDWWANLGPGFKAAPKIVAEDWPRNAKKLPSGAVAPSALVTRTEAGPSQRKLRVNCASYMDHLFGQTWPKQNTKWRQYLMVHMTKM